MAKNYCTNVYPWGYAGETRDIKHIDAASIGPNKPRKEQVAKTSFSRGQATKDPPGTPLYG